MKIFIYKKTIGPIILKDQCNAKSKTKSKNIIIHDKLRTIGNITYNSHSNIFLTLCKENVSLEEITSELEIYTNNFNSTIIELLNTMDKKHLEVVTYIFDNIIENQQFNDFSIIQKYNSLYILCNIVGKLDIIKVDKTVYIDNIINKCKTNYKLKYIKVDNILINSNEFKEIFTAC